MNKKLFTEKFTKNLEGWEGRREKSKEFRKKRSEEVKNWKALDKSGTFPPEKRRSLYPALARKVPPDFPSK